MPHFLQINLICLFCCRYFDYFLSYNFLLLKKLIPVSPGELLKEEFLDPMGISQYRLAKEIEVPAQRIGAIVSGKRSITADTDLRLCKFFGLSNGYWLRAQAAYDIELAEEKLEDELENIKHWKQVVG